jgi:Flp pilus assembly protein TadG
MTSRRTPDQFAEVTMKRNAGKRSRQHGERGQILVVAVLSLIAMIGGVSLVLEGGNAYAHQRVAQNAADAVANAGATILAERLGGGSQGDGQVLAATANVADLNGLDSYSAYYTDVDAKLLNPAGIVVGNTSAAAQVGGGVIPPNTQGVQVTGNLTFPTTFARVLGMNAFRASADATSVTGALIGGLFLPVVFPVNIVDCAGDGSIAGVGEENWEISEPGDPPVGQEYIVPLCKTDAGSFMILDLDGTMNNCDDEVSDPPNIQFAAFPATIQSDNGNNCAKEMVDEVNKLAGKVVLIPICDGDCVTAGGSNAEYHMIRVAAFYLDYMSDVNGGTNAMCDGNGTTLIPIAGNGSSSCLAGWFVRYVTKGPVGRGTIDGAGAIGIQLKR